MFFFALYAQVCFSWVNLPGFKPILQRCFSSDNNCLSRLFPIQGKAVALVTLFQLILNRAAGFASSFSIIFFKDTRPDLLYPVPIPDVIDIVLVDIANICRIHAARLDSAGIVQKKIGPGLGAEVKLKGHDVYYFSH